MIIPRDIVAPAIGLNEQFFDLQGLSAYSCISVSALRSYIKKPKGALPCFKVKGKILVKRSEFDAWVEQYRLNRSQDLKDLVQEVMDQIKE